MKNLIDKIDVNYNKEIDDKNKNEENNSILKNSYSVVNKEKKTTTTNNNYLYNFLRTHISLLFIPLPLHFLLQLVSLYLLAYIGCAEDAHKQLNYLIYCLEQFMSILFSIIPLIF